MPDLGVLLVPIHPPVPCNPRLGLHSYRPPPAASWLRLSAANSLDIGGGGFHRAHNSRSRLRNALARLHTHAARESSSHVTVYDRVRHLSDYFGGDAGRGRGQTEVSHVRFILVHYR